MRYTTLSEIKSSCSIIYLTGIRGSAELIGFLRNIFLQLCTGGDLFTYITGPMGAGNPLCEAEAKYIMYQLLEGLRYLHDLMISHRGTGFSTFSRFDLSDPVT